MSIELDEATDRLNTELVKAEKTLIALAVIVSAEVPLDDGHLLGFGKKERDWILYVRADGIMQPLISMSRAVRTKAAHQLPALWVALTNETEAQVRQVNEAAQVAAEFNKILSNGKANK
jgi:hypothetical protein